MSNETTVYQLIQRLATYPGDLPVIVRRSGQRRRMSLVNVIRAWDGRKVRDEIELFVDWEAPKGEEDGQ